MGHEPFAALNGYELRFRSGGENNRPPCLRIESDVPGIIWDGVDWESVTAIGCRPTNLGFA